jgi:hypothetical protein
MPDQYDRGFLKGLPGQVLVTEDAGADWVDSSVVTSSGLGIINVKDPTYGATGDGVTNDRAAIQAALDALPPTGGTVVFPRGNYLLAGGRLTLTGKSDVVIDVGEARITQTAPLTEILLLTDMVRTKVVDGYWFGLGTDFVNTSAVHVANAVSIFGACQDVVVSGCVMQNFAGAGIRINSTTATDVRISECKIAGPGLAEITPVTDNFGASVLIDQNLTRWSVDGCDLSGNSQGIASGTLQTDVRIVGNYIHDVTGQHGMYLTSVQSAVISDNLVCRTALQGLKIQQALAWGDATDISIVGNTFVDTGNGVVSSPGHAILLTRASGANTARRVSIVGNTIRGTAGGDGINLLNCDQIVIGNNSISDARVGINGSTCNGITIIGNKIETTDRQGINLVAVTETSLIANTVLNQAQENFGGTEVGIMITGASTDITVHRNRVVDTLGNAAYGFYFDPTSMATFSVCDNYASGATSYGMRFPAATAIREYRDNDVSGTVARVLNPPTGGVGTRARQEFGSAAPASGTYSVGDIVWNTTPTAGGTMGWVCTTAGTPGTWKTFGSIAA